MCIFHDWVKIEKEPHEIYFDYSGNRVGIFRCRCKKCGKIRNKKFLSDFFH